MKVADLIQFFLNEKRQIIDRPVVQSDPDAPYTKEGEQTRLSLLGVGRATTYGSSPKGVGPSSFTVLPKTHPVVVRQHVKMANKETDRRKAGAHQRAREGGAAKEAAGRENPTPAYSGDAPSAKLGGRSNLSVPTPAEKEANVKSAEARYAVAKTGPVIPSALPRDPVKAKMKEAGAAAKASVESGTPVAKINRKTGEVVKTTSRKTKVKTNFNLSPRGARRQAAQLALKAAEDQRRFVSAHTKDSGDLLKSAQAKEKVVIGHIGDRAVTKVVHTGKPKEYSPAEALNAEVPGMASAADKRKFVVGKHFAAATDRMNRENPLPPAGFVRRPHVVAADRAAELRRGPRVKGAQELHQLNVPEPKSDRQKELAADVIAKGREKAVTSPTPPEEKKGESVMDNLIKQSLALFEEEDIPTYVAPGKPKKEKKEKVDTPKPKAELGSNQVYQFNPYGRFVRGMEFKPGGTLKVNRTTVHPARQYAPGLKPKGFSHKVAAHHITTTAGGSNAGIFSAQDVKSSEQEALRQAGEVARGDLQQSPDITTYVSPGAVEKLASKYRHNLAGKRAAETSKTATLRTAKATASLDDSDVPLGQSKGTNPEFDAKVAGSSRARATAEAGRAKAKHSPTQVDITQATDALAKDAGMKKIGKLIGSVVAADLGVSTGPRPHRRIPGATKIVDTGRTGSGRPAKGPAVLKAKPESFRKELPKSINKIDSSFESGRINNLIELHMVKKGIHIAILPVDGSKPKKDSQAPAMVGNVASGADPMGDLRARLGLERKKPKTSGPEVFHAMFKDK